MRDSHRQSETGPITEQQKTSLEKAFATFQRQCDALERTHADLRQQLKAAELSLEEKNRELAGRIREIESMREKLAGVLRSITDAVILADPDGGILLANQAADQLLLELDATGKSLAEVPELAPLLTGRAPIHNRQLSITIQDDPRDFLVSAVPMSIVPAVGRSTVLCIKEVTEQRRLQERLSRENRLAALGKVAASVAHEIRNPLAAIEGFARLLERDLEDQPRLQRLAGKTIYGARQLNSVVSNLLNFTRELKPASEPCDINALIRDALEFCIPIAADRKITVETVLAENPPVVLFSPLQFKQVITNLVLNAIDACTLRENGHIIIRTERTRKRKKGITINVIDNGGGITDDNKRRIFEPFFTLKEGGVGLGLALCQRIVETHGGDIVECGKEGVSAHFVICLEEHKTGGVDRNASPLKQSEPIS